MESLALAFETISGVSPELMLKPARTNLFTVRVWEESTGRKERKIRVKVQHVLSGEVRYFREWSDVIAFLLAIVEREEG